jgi:hypothetical protein
MKNYILSIAALCAFASASAVIEEAFLPENLMQCIVQGEICKNILGLTQILDSYAAGDLTEDQLKQEITQIVGMFKNIPNDNSQRSMMLMAEAELFQQAFAAVADVARKNQLPALDAKRVRKGVDVQAARLKVIGMIEAALK